MEMNAYQELANKIDQVPKEAEGQPSGPEIMVPLLGLAGEVGELLSEYKKYLPRGRHPQSSLSSA